MASNLIYLDNAATTQLDPAVLTTMLAHYRGNDANPSSLHGPGQRSKVALEQARKLISKLLQGRDGHFFFTSGATEANNWAIKGVVEANNCQHIITSPIEHASLLQPAIELKKRGTVELHFVELEGNGAIHYTHLEKLLKQYPKALVSLMHGNNEIGNVTNIALLGSLCHRHGALFHSDMAQTLGHYPINLSKLPVDLCSGSAHKLHGPKGIGFL